MMRRALALVCAAAAFLLALACWMQAMKGSYTGYGRVWRMRFSTVQELSSQGRRELEQAGAVAVLELPGEIKAPLFGRNQLTTVITAEGDPSLLFQQGSLVEGRWPGPGECVIDGESAQRLWGGVFTGQKIIHEERSYIVSGVVESVRPLLLIPAGAKVSYRYINHRIPTDVPFAAQELDRLRTKAGIPEPATRTDLDWGCSALRAIALVPPWGMAMYAAMVLFRHIFNKKSLRAAGLVVTAPLCAKALGVPNLITPDMLPTRWSEFNFWQQRFEQLEEAFYVKHTLPGLLPDYLLLTQGISVAVWSLGALVFSILVLRLFRSAKPVLYWKKIDEGGCENAHSVS